MSEIEADLSQGRSNKGSVFGACTNQNVQIADRAFVTVSTHRMPANECEAYVVLQQTIHQLDFGLT